MKRGLVTSGVGIVGSRRSEALLGPDDELTCVDGFWPAPNRTMHIDQTAVVMNCCTAKPAFRATGGLSNTATSRSRHHSHRRSALRGWWSTITLEDRLREINDCFTHRLSQEGTP